MNKNYDNYIANIKKTGFPLEYSISKDLQSRSWNVISNRYYIDDTTNNMREIDILAYKVSLVNEIRFYTTLLISSKKSEERDWAFLTKKLNQNDPNSDYFPTSNWTNDERLTHMLDDSTWRKRLIDEVSKDEKLAAIYSINEDLFAFQEMNKSNGRIQNDKAIYSSVSTLVKSLSYEVLNLDRRIEHKSFYSFYLISVVESGFVKLHFEESNIECSDIDEINYLNRFIVNGKDDFYKIHFIKNNCFADSLVNYDYLHKWNVNFFSKLRTEYEKDLVKDWKKLGIQLNKHKVKMQHRLYHLVQSRYFDSYQIDYLIMVYESDNRSLRICVSEDQKFVDFLTDSKEVNELTQNMLQEFFFYTGKFYYSTDSLPF
ncbi:MAG: hypothetical protein ACRBG0_21375 [Lewinella sp.]|uniref:hypothetical protein n=1 Tax=Lewinella sp. TaxID=2004506 RepID=UPI003D6C064A